MLRKGPLFTAMDGRHTLLLTISGIIILLFYTSHIKKTHVNQITQEEVEVHTNRIEGAWKHAKDHFRKISGTKITQFEGHLA